MSSGVSRIHGKRGAVGDDGTEIAGVRLRASQYFSAGIDRDHVRVPGDERSAGDPGSGTHVEHAEPGEWTERVEDLLRIRGARSGVLVGDRFERSHVAIIAERDDGTGQGDTR